MGTGFWIRRYVLAFAIAFAVIAGAQYLLRDRVIGEALRHGLLWAAITAAVYVAAAYRRYRKCQRCAMCNDPWDG